MIGPGIRGVLAGLALTGVLAAPGGAQLSAFEWTLKGSTLGSGVQTPEGLTVIGPDGGGCSDGSTWFETVAPVSMSVTVTLDFEDHDAWAGANHFDAPAWLIDGKYHLPGTGGGGSGWQSGPYTFNFDVAAGQRFGLGVWSMDCQMGPGIAHFRSLSFETLPITSIPSKLGPKHVAFELKFPSMPPTASVVVPAGDMDGDGTPDFVVGLTGSASGRVQVRSGRDGSLLMEAHGPPGFGSAVAVVGDTDGDGVPDVLVGAPLLDDPQVGSGAGRAWLLSGRDGTVRLEIAPETSEARLGTAVAPAGDVDGDGLCDLLVGAPGVGGHFKPPVFGGSPPQPPPGRVIVVSSATGERLRTYLAETNQHFFGRSLALAPDLDGDGVPDHVIGAPQVSPFVGPPNVRAFSGADGALLWMVTGPATFGTSVAVTSDLDGDGVPDVMVGAPGFATSSQGPFGVVGFLSGADGALLVTWTGAYTGYRFGTDVADAGDVDGDGIPDLMITMVKAKDPSIGYTLIRSYPEGKSIAALPAAAGGAPGPGSAAPGDLNGDGRGDVITGGQSSVIAWRGLHKFGAPTLSASGPLLPGTELSVSVGMAEPAAPALLVIGVSKAPQAFLGGVLVPAPDMVVPFVTDGQGNAAFSFRWPDVTPPQWNLWLQAWVVDASGPMGATATDTVVVSVE